MVRFAGSVRLTKPEVFDACQALADADRFLLRAGRTEEAGALYHLFELLEERLSAGLRPDRAQPLFGSNSSESELTQ
jgi:hypothetical protein